MAARAARSFPALTFRVGNADALPYGDGTFDAVTCCFGLLHLERPEQAIAEAFRVLRPGGRFGYVVWQGPAAGGTLVGILLKTFQRLGTMEVDLPPAPPMFQFAEAETRDRVLAAAGFTAIAGRDLDIRWRATAPEAIGRLLKDGMVRTRLIFERQTPAVQASILAAVIAEARAFATPSGIEIPNAAHLVTAVRPGTQRRSADDLRTKHSIHTARRTFRYKQRSSCALCARLLGIGDLDRKNRPYVFVQTPRQRVD
jgi:SAM-dependent methyltransferase